jgi:hypothetical protein
VPRRASILVQEPEKSQYPMTRLFIDNQFKEASMSYNKASMSHNKNNKQENESLKEPEPMYFSLRHHLQHPTKCPIHHSSFPLNSTNPFQTAIRTTSTASQPLQQFPELWFCSQPTQLTLSSSTSTNQASTSNLNLLLIVSLFSILFMIHAFMSKINSAMPYKAPLASDNNEPTTNDPECCNIFKASPDLITLPTKDMLSSQRYVSNNSLPMDVLLQVQQQQLRQQFQTSSAKHLHPRQPRFKTFIPDRGKLKLFLPFAFFPIWFFQRPSTFAPSLAIEEEKHEVASPFGTSPFGISFPFGIPSGIVFLRALIPFSPDSIQSHVTSSFLLIVFY